MAGLGGLAGAFLCIELISHAAPFVFGASGKRLFVKFRVYFAGFAFCRRFLLTPKCWFIQHAVCLPFGEFISQFISVMVEEGITGGRDALLS